MVNFLKKNKGISLIIFLNLILFLADLIISINIKYINIIEVNPLYHIGGFWLVGLYNIVLFTSFYIIYVRSKKPDVRYVFMTYLTTMFLFRILIIINNWAYITNPISHEEALMVTQAVKNDVMIKLSLLNIVPIFVDIISWIFYRIDHKVQIR